MQKEHSKKSPPGPRHRQLLAAQEKQKRKNNDKKNSHEQGERTYRERSQTWDAENTSSLSQNRGAASVWVVTVPLSFNTADVQDIPSTAFGPMRGGGKAWRNRYVTRGETGLLEGQA